MELQNIYVDLILNLIFKNLKNGKESVSEAVRMMTDMGISNELFKEHIITLSMD